MAHESENKRVEVRMSFADCPRVYPVNFIIFIAVIVCLLHVFCASFDDGSLIGNIDGSFPTGLGIGLFGLCVCIFGRRIQGQWEFG